MTCIIALKNNTGVYFACDSAVTDLSGPSMMTAKPKIHQLAGGNIILGVSGNYLVLEALQKNLKIERNQEPDGIYGLLLAIKSCLKDIDGGLTDSFILTSFMGEIYHISLAVFSVARPFGDYFAIGSGQPYALGSLYSTQKESADPIGRVKKALMAAQEFDYKVKAPFHMVHQPIRQAAKPALFDDNDGDDEIYSPPSQSDDPDFKALTQDKYCIKPDLKRELEPQFQTFKSTVEQQYSITENI